MPKTNKPNPDCNKCQGTGFVNEYHSAQQFLGEPPRIGTRVDEVKCRECFPLLSGVLMSAPNEFSDETYCANMLKNIAAHSPLAHALKEIERQREEIERLKKECDAVEEIEKLSKKGCTCKCTCCWHCEFNPRY